MRKGREENLWGVMWSEEKGGEEGKGRDIRRDGVKINVKRGEGERGVKKGVKW